MKQHLDLKQETAWKGKHLNDVSYNIKANIAYLMDETIVYIIIK